MTNAESSHCLHAAEIHFTSDLKNAATGFPLCMYHAYAHAQDLWICEPLCAPLNKANKSKKSCICFLSCLCDSILLRRNGFYINFLCCRFLCPAYPSLSRCVSAALFLHTIFIWKQSIVSYCWFLCGSIHDSFFFTAGSCVAAARIPIVGSCVTTIRYPLIIFMLGQLGWWDVG